MDFRKRKLVRAWLRSQRELETKLLRSKDPSEKVEICIDHFQQFEPELKEIFYSNFPDEAWTFEIVDSWLYDQLIECKKLGLAKDKKAWGHIWKCANLINELYQDTDTFKSYLSYTTKKELPFR